MSQLSKPRGIEVTSLPFREAGKGGVQLKGLVCVLCLQEPWGSHTQHHNSPNHHQDSSTALTMTPKHPV